MSTVAGRVVLNPHSAHSLSNPSQHAVEPARRVVVVAGQARGLEWPQHLVLPHGGMDAGDGSNDSSAALKPGPSCTSAAML